MLPKASGEAEIARLRREIGRLTEQLAESERQLADCRRELSTRREFERDRAVRAEQSEAFIAESLRDVMALPPDRDAMDVLLRRIGEEFAVSEFEPYAFEMPVGYGSEAGSYRLVTPSGTEITVEGIIDRVDVLNKNGKRYVRVVDYKSGSKKFELCDVFYGINIQMLVYLFSIWNNGRGGLSSATPAGVLYMPAKDAVLTMSRNSEEEKISEEISKKFRMNGLLLDDPDVLNAMEPGLGGIFIPVKRTKDSYSGSVATLAELGQIKSHVDSLLCDMAEELSGGKIFAIPYRRDGKLSCERCQYHSICRRSENAAFAEHESFKDKDFYNLTKGGEELG